MPFTSDIKKSNIKENWLFELEYFNGDSNGNGSGGFDKVFQADGTTLNLTREALDDSETGVDVDDETVFEVGDFIKVDDEVMEVTAVAVSDVISVRRGALGTTAAAHNDNTQIFFHNYLGLAFSDIVYNKRLYKGAVLNNPSLRERIELYSSTSKRSNISIQIPDFEFKGLPISQELNKTHQYINRTCSIYSIVNDSARVKIGSFRVSSISTNGKTININMATFQPWDNLKVPNVKVETTGRYFPLVYGDYTGAASSFASPAYIDTMPNTLFPVEVDSTSFYFFCPIHEDIGSTGTRLRVYENGFNKFTPLEVKFDAESYRGGFALKAETNLRRSFKFKPIGTISTDFVNPTNIFDATVDHGDSNSFGTLNFGTVGSTTTNSSDNTQPIVLNKDTTFEIPAFDDPPDKTSTSDNHGLTFEIVWNMINFFAETTDPNEFQYNRVTAIDLSVPGSETTLTNGLYTSDSSASQSAPGETTTTRTSSKDMATLYSSSGGFPDGIKLRYKREAFSTSGSTDVSIHHDTDANVLKLYDFRFKATFAVDRFNLVSDGNERIKNVKYLYSNSDGFQHGITGLSGTADSINDAHLDLLNRFCDLDVPTNPNTDLEGWSALHTVRNNWYLRWWCHSPKDLGSILEQMQFEGCFIFRYRYDGEPQYIHIPNSPSSVLQLSKNDISDINLYLSDPNDIVTKMSVNYDIHPELRTYQFNVTSSNTNSITKYNIQSKENVRNIDLDMLVAQIGDSNPVGEDKNDNFLAYQNALFGDIFLNVEFDIVNPSKWVDSSLNPIEVGDIIDFDNSNMFPETPMGFNNASWSSLNFVILEMKRTVGKVSVKVRSV